VFSAFKILSIYKLRLVLLPFKWLFVWFPTEWPASTIFLNISEFAFTFLPMQKNVGFALYFFISFNVHSVISVVGPSSRVR
jgi:hypothetical protein